MQLQYARAYIRFDAGVLFMIASFADGQSKRFDAGQAGDALITGLNGLASEGWELVSISGAAPNYDMILKRQSRGTGRKNSISSNL